MLAWSVVTAVETRRTFRKYLERRCTYERSKKSLGTVISCLEELFQKFNDKFYAGKLEQPIITVSPDTTGGAYGWCTAWKAWKDDVESSADEGYYEINLCAEHLNRPFEQICGTLLHEMVHLYNLYEGVQDTSRGGTYHNLSLIHI